MNEAFMLEAIEQSKLGFPAPNPRVGCVIVQDNEVVGRGHCARYGGDHAEVMALKEAGQRARGATAYVTLEPCNHFGKTPPCSHALVDAGISSVFYALADPNPIAAGGADHLINHGVLVKSGLLIGQAAEVNRQFLFAISNQRPLVTLKAGITLDGKVALPNGESKWITSEGSRADAMKLRAEAGSVMVGRVTAEFDRARLTVRGVEGVNQPLRVVIDPRNALDQQLPIFDEEAPTLHLTHVDSIGSPQDILARIWERKQTGVLVEGGPTTSAHFLKSQLADQIVLYVAPKILGEGKSWMGPFDLQNLSDSPEFQLVETAQIGPDLKLTYRSGNLQRFLSSYDM